MPTPVRSNLTRLQYPIATLLLTLLFALTASAQIITGTIQGTVQDSNGAVLPGANGSTARGGVPATGCPPPPGARQYVDVTRTRRARPAGH